MPLGAKIPVLPESMDRLLADSLIENIRIVKTKANADAFKNMLEAMTDSLKQVRDAELTAEEQALYKFKP